MKTTETTMPSHKVVSREEWIEARKAHLVKEKELTRARDELSRERRELPWVKVEKNFSRRVQLPRPRPERPRRGGAAVDHGVGATPR